MDHDLALIDKSDDKSGDSAAQGCSSDSSLILLLTRNSMGAVLALVAYTSLLVLFPRYQTAPGMVGSSYYHSKPGGMLSRWLQICLSVQSLAFANFLWWYAVFPEAMSLRKHRALWVVVGPDRLKSQGR